MDEIGAANGAVAVSSPDLWVLFFEVMVIDYLLYCRMVGDIGYYAMKITSIYDEYVSLFYNDLNKE